MNKGRQAETAAELGDLIASNQFYFCRGFPVRRTRNENPRLLSHGSTVAVISSTG